MVTPAASPSAGPPMPSAATGISGPCPTPIRNASPGAMVDSPPPNAMPATAPTSSRARAGGGWAMGGAGAARAASGPVAPPGDAPTDAGSAPAATATNTAAN